MDNGTLAILLGSLFALLILKGLRKMSVDFSRLNAALDALASSVDSVAEAIRNPQVDTASQATADEMAARLDNVAQGLRGLADEENAMDNADAIVETPPESTPIEEPAPTEEQPA